MRRQKSRVLNVLLSAAIVFTTVFIPSSAGAGWSADGQYIIGDGSGGGGGGAAGSNKAGGAGGNGGGGNDTITGSSANDVIFGDGSGGGAGCRSVGGSLNPRGGTGGGGDDLIYGGAGDDIIFGDGFNGQDYMGWYPGNGGLGGGGAGGSGGIFGQPPTGGIGGIGGGGGGAGGSGSCYPGATLIAGVGNPGGNQNGAVGGNGGQSALANESEVPGQGGLPASSAGGGGAGFGGAAGGNAGYNSNGLGGADGDDHQYTYDDSTGSIFGYFTEAVLRSLLVSNPNFGGGNDIINGGAGFNNLFGLGGYNTFIVDSADNAVRTVIWDLKYGDKLLLQNDGILVSEITTGSILDNAVYGDFDGDELEDDTRITFNGRPIDLIDVIISRGNNVGTGGEISPANSAPTVNLYDGIIGCNFTSTNTPGFGFGFVNDRDGDQDWDGGTLEVQITSNANVNDRIGIFEETLLTPELNISETSVSSGGVTFAAIPPVISVGADIHQKFFAAGSSKFTVEFNNNATNELVRRVVNMLIFNTTTSGDGNRIATVKLTDKHGNSTTDTVAIGDTAAQVAPVLTSAATDTSGRKIYVTFDKDMMLNPEGRQKQFTVTVDNVDYSAIEISNDNSDSTLELTLPFSVLYGQSVKLSYTKGSIKALNTGALENFELQEVTNNVPSTCTVPEAPLNVTAAAGNGQATVSFDAPFDGGSPITEYIVTTSPGGITTTGSAISTSGSAISITVDGLTNGVSYSFTVKAVNAAGEGPESSASNEVTPQAQDNGGGNNGGGNNGGGDNGGGNNGGGDNGGGDNGGGDNGGGDNGGGNNGGGNNGGGNNGGGNNGGGSNVNGTTPAAEDTGVVILVNGKTQNAATVTVSKIDDRSVLTFTIDENKVKEKIEQEGNNAIVTIPVKKSADIYISKLNGQIVKYMESKQAVLEIKTENATYTIPAAQINIENLSEKLGRQIALKDITVDIKISASSAAAAKLVKDTASSKGYKVVVNPVDFDITCYKGSSSVDVTKFNGYVERMLTVPEGVDTSEITTGVVYNSNGTFSHVPTRITVIDGKYYARINSLTNSTYSVIYSPKSFEDVEKHWAKAAVNDMGSRLVITGNTNGMFEPQKDITRAEFAAIVVNGLGLMRPGTGKSNFTDVQKDKWYYDAVSIASEYGLVAGYGNGKFGPNDKVTREQAMAIISKAMDITGLKVQLASGEQEKLLSAFKDGTKAAEYSKSGIAACLKAELVKGQNNGLIAPKSNITRAEVAVIIRNLLQKSKLI